MYESAGIQDDIDSHINLVIRRIQKLERIADIQKNSSSSDPGKYNLN
jgi:hypothetical protein